MKRVLLVAITLVFATACSDGVGPIAADADTPSFSHVEAPAGFPDEVTISFGRDDVGTTFFPPGEHDASFRAKDKIRPRLTHLAAGGNVTFDMGSIHGVAIYEPGTEPDDIEVGPATLEDLVVPFPPFVIPDFLIDDPDGRVTDRSPVSLEPMQWSPPAGTFDEPGRYLVICYVAPHFVFAKMYAFIDVH